MGSDINNKEENKNNKRKLIIVIFILLMITVLTGFILLGYFLRNIPNKDKVNTVDYEYTYLPSEVVPNIELDESGKETTYEKIYQELTMNLTMSTNSDGFAIGTEIDPTYIVASYLSSTNNISLHWGMSHQDGKLLYKINTLKLYLLDNKESEVSSKVEVVVTNFVTTSNGFTYNIEKSSNKEVVLHSLYISFSIRA